MDVMNGDLAFLPLGGTGEIGMNLNLYRCDGAWLAVDCGIGFSGNDMPEVEILMPDPSFIAGQRDNLVGLVITHAHEDHLGAVAHLWSRLGCPIYATPVRGRSAPAQAGRGGAARTRRAERGRARQPLHARSVSRCSSST